MVIFSVLPCAAVSVKEVFLNDPSLKWTRPMAWVQKIQRHELAQRIAVQTSKNQRRKRHNRRHDDSGYLGVLAFPSDYRHLSHQGADNEALIRLLQKSLFLVNSMFSSFRFFLTLSIQIFP